MDAQKVTMQGVKGSVEKKQVKCYNNCKKQEAIKQRRAQAQ